MAEEKLTQEQIDRVILGGATVDEVSGESTKRLGKAIAKAVLGNQSETMGNRNTSESRLRRPTLRGEPNLLHNYRFGNRTVLIGQDQGRDEGEALRSYPLKEYALLTFDLRSGAIQESINSFSRSLVGRVLEGEHKYLTRDGGGLLVAKFGSVKGVYKLFRSRYISRAEGVLYEHRIIDQVPDDKEGFVGRLEDVLRDYTASMQLLPVYVQKELKTDLCTAMDNLGIVPAIECDLGSFPRQERKRS